MAMAHEWIREIEDVQTLAELEELKGRLLGKTGLLAEQLRGLANLSGEQKKERGGELNCLKEACQKAFDERREVLRNQEMRARLEKERLDMSFPATYALVGRMHPLKQVMSEAVSVFSSMGFDVAYGPDVESVAHNFDALNVAPEHPSRSLQDTFYMHNDPTAQTVLRTHTSPVQIREMRKGNLPLRFISPGRAWRPDSDQTHSPMFHQLEGLVIEKGIHMGHLRGCLEAFFGAFFGRTVQTRFRPSFFPFTEPSVEVDLSCTRRGGELRIGEGEEWLELLGAGMVHPHVLKHCGIDEAQWQGFAFGMGLERLAMLKYGIPDLRNFFEGDQRWLWHYGFPASTPGL